MNLDSLNTFGAARPRRVHKCVPIATRQPRAIHVQGHSVAGAHALGSRHNPRGTVHHRRLREHCLAPLAEDVVPSAGGPVREDMDGGGTACTAAAVRCPAEGSRGGRVDYNGDREVFVGLTHAAPLQQPPGRLPPDGSGGTDGIAGGGPRGFEARQVGHC